MELPRRRLIRQPPPPPNQQHVTKLRARLDHERTTLLRWQAKLRRAFNAVDRTQKRITRLERKLAQMERTS